MNYSKIYNDLVAKALPRGLNKSEHEGYFEIHHIIPRCMGGSDDKENLVMFTGREHYIAHMLLWKIYPKNSGLINAAWMMIYCGRNNKVSSRLYENLRIAHSEVQSNRSKLLVGELNPFFGKTHSDESKQKMRNKRLGVLPANTGVPKSDEIKAKISATKKSANAQPWEAPIVVNNIELINLWLESDWLYLMWTLMDRPKFNNFGNYYNTWKLTDHITSRFNGIVNKFMEGWVPNEDPSWLEFKEKYERT